MQVYSKIISNEFGICYVFLYVIIIINQSIDLIFKNCNIFL